MKKLGKKVIGSFVAAFLVVSMVAATGAFAASSSSTPAPGYGTLRGAISVHTGLQDFYLTTSVETNTDNAYLTGKVDWQDKLGNTTSSASIQSSRGEPLLFEFWTFVGGFPYQAFATHGVQGGNTYGAKAVYTNTTL